MMIVSPFLERMKSIIEALQAKAGEGGGFAVAY